jgi:hypothetical protein
MCSPEKSLAVPPSLSTCPFSPVRFVDEILRNTGIFRGFRSKGPPEFDCNQDLLAERVGFEFSQKRGFNNIENTAGTVKAIEDSGKQC